MILQQQYIAGIPAEIVIGCIIGIPVALFLIWLLVRKGEDQ